MSIRDGPSEKPRPSIQYHRHHDGHPGAVLLNFSSVTIVRGTKWQTLSLLQHINSIPPAPPPTKKNHRFVLVKRNPSVTVISPQKVKPRASPVISSWWYTKRAVRTDEMLYGISSWSCRERLGCLFIICIQSSFDTVPHSSFSETTKRHSLEIPFLASFATQTHEMVPPYQILLTITDSLRVWAVV